MKVQKCSYCKGLGVICSYDGKDIKCEQCEDGYIEEIFGEYNDIKNYKNEILEILDDIE